MLHCIEDWMSDVVVADVEETSSGIAVATLKQIL